MRNLSPFLAIFTYLSPFVAFADDAGIEFFEKKVRPLLVKQCYECHSSEAKELKGGLALDSKGGWTNGGDSGPAIKPGDVDGSILISAVRYEDYEMPPKGKMTQAEIAVLEKWVKMGSPDPRDGQPIAPLKKEFDLEKARQFWAFQRPSFDAAPKVNDDTWPCDDIDRFILAAIEDKGLAPARDANARTMIRRITYDLTGLPPTPKEVEAFEQETIRNPEFAVRDLVDGLLESPQFGEHWGRHWLDVARYSDSNGGDFNATHHHAWRYRNYVIRAFNKDKPFDQFIREQIAGDLLASQSDEQRADNIVATGFLMLGAKMLSERDKTKLQMDIVDEQIDTVGRAFMGLTLGCARCHDHKFDPIPTEDYYALAGIFRSTTTVEGEFQQYVSKWKVIDLPVSEQRVEALKKHEKATKELSTKLGESKKILESANNESARLTGKDNGLVFDDVSATLEGEWKRSTYSPNFIGKGYIHDDNRDKGKKSVTFVANLPNAARYEVQLSYTGGSGRSQNIPVRIQHADGIAKLTINQKPKPPIDKMFLSLGQFRFESAHEATITISNEGTQGHVIADAVRFIELDNKGEAVSAQTSVTTEELQKIQDDIERAKQRVRELEGEIKQLKEATPQPLPKAIAVVESKDKGDCEICIRGEHKNRGSKVARSFVRVAMYDSPPLFSDSESGRRELADWIASPENPLTARVIVNRIWSHLMGEGIVRSVDNFGHLGQRPTHPELLDRLAIDFINDGWSVKRMVRRIMLTRSYGISSDHDERLWQADPENRLLWRFHRRRLPAEAIRDSLLAISGQLDPAHGESPVSHLGKMVTDNSPTAKEYARQDTKKRSLYMPIIRNELPPILVAFDFADPDLTTGRRNVTNVPSQALLLMNSPFVIDCCQRVGKKLVADESSSDRDRVVRIYELILTREPTEAEINRALDFVTAQDQSDPAVWAQFVQVLFASTEFRILN